MSQSFPPAGIRAFYVCSVSPDGHETLELGPYASMELAEANVHRVREAWRPLMGKVRWGTWVYDVSAYTKAEGELPKGEMNDALWMHEPQGIGERVLRQLHRESSAVNWKSTVSFVGVLLAVFLLSRCEPC